MKRPFKIELNQDVKCKQCGKLGATKTDEMDDYGICLECVNKNIRGLGMNKTREQIKHEIGNVLDNYWDNIKGAYEKSGFSLKIDIKIGLEAIGEETGITPSLEFYPLPKTKSEKYTVRVNEKQIRLAGM